MDNPINTTTTAPNKGIVSAVKTYLHKHKHALATSCALFFTALFLIFLARTIPSFSPWYNKYLFPILPNTLGRLLSPLPFSLFEMLICAALALAAVFFVFLLLSLWSKKGRKKIRGVVGRGFPVVLCILCAMFFMQTLTCLLNYNRVDFSEEAGLVSYTATDAELTELCQLLISDLDQLLFDPTSEESNTDTDTTGAGTADGSIGAAPLLFDEEGRMSLDNIDVGSEAKAAMIKLGETYPALSGYYPNPKPIFFSSVMSTVNLTGIFSPYTTEANYNRDVTPYVIPYTICHELAHAKGFIKENEAGFIAYLASSGADSPQLRYSGALNALSYSLNALYRNVSEEDYMKILRTVPAQALKDLQENQLYWQQFHKGIRGTISDTARAANDNYLKANAQSDGAKSYGRMVDLLLAYYKIGADPI